MAVGGKDQALQTQRRDRVDGGLNTRRAPFLLDDSQVLDIRNLGFQEEGSLKSRKYATILKQSNWAGAGLLPAPTLTQIVGGGTLPAGTYTIAYYLSASPGGIARYTSPSATAAIVVNLNDRIQIDIPPLNLGEGQGQGTDGADDPFNGGTSGPVLAVIASVPIFTVLVKKTGDPDFTHQGVTFAWNSSALKQRATLAAYSIGSTLTDADGGFPLRFIMWNPATQALIGITVDKAVQFAGDFSAVTRFALANDKAGNPHFWSRIPTRMRSAYLDQFPVISDNLSRPKRLHWTGSIATSNWRLLGANPPASAPSIVLNAVAGNLNGAYQYKVAFVYRDGRGDLTTADTESNASAASNTVSPANQKIDVTIPGSLETGLQARRVYRTKGGGTVFFFHSDQAAGTGNLTFTDNTADSGLGISTPVDDVGKIGNDVPPNKIAHLTSHMQRCFAFESNYLVDAQNRIIDYIATNFLRCTKAASSGTSESINAWPSEFRFECGDATPPTGLISHRGSLYWFKANSIGQLQGNDETDFVPVELLPGVGAMRDSIVSVGSLIYFWEDARAAMTFDGSSYQRLSYEIQLTWDVDREAGFFPLCAWFDPNREEIRWSFTNLNTAPGTDPSAATFKEYVLSVPNKAWTVYDGINTGLTSSRSIAAATRVVLAANISRQVFTQVLALFSGIAAKDQAAGTPIDAGDSESSTSTFVQFKTFFGEDWQTVKTVRALELYSVIPVGVTLVVAAALLNNKTFVTIATLTGDATRPDDRVDVIDIPTETFTRTPSVSDKISQDRGILFKLTIDQAAASSFVLRGAALKYKDMDDMRRSP